MSETPCRSSEFGLTGGIPVGHRTAPIVRFTHTYHGMRQQTTDLRRDRRIFGGVGRLMALDRCVKKVLKVPAGEAMGAVLPILGNEV